MKLNAGRKPRAHSVVTNTGAQVTNPRQAFTLLELLVIVAILIILAMVSWPALCHTRNRSQEEVDFYNNKQLIAAANMYAADQNEVLPGNGWGTSSDCWAHAANLPAGPVASTAAFTVTLSNQIEFCKRGQLFPYVRSQKTFLCPLDNKTNGLFYQRAIYFTSYVWNGAVSGYGSLPAGRSYKITEFKPNSILQWEADALQPFYFNDCSEFPDEGLSGRHGLSATVGLISGGTQGIPVRTWYTPIYAGVNGGRGDSIPASFLPNPAWCNPGKRNGLQ